MHPEINAALLTPFDRQLLRAAACESCVLLLVFPACVPCVALPRDYASVSRVPYVGNCMGERSDTSKSGKDAFDVCPRTTRHKSLVRALSRVLGQCEPGIDLVRLTVVIKSDWY